MPPPSFQPAPRSLPPQQSLSFHVPPATGIFSRDFHRDDVPANITYRPNPGNKATSFEEAEKSWENAQKKLGQEEWSLSVAQENMWQGVDHLAFALTGFYEIREQKKQGWRERKMERITRRQKRKQETIYRENCAKLQMRLQEEAWKREMEKQGSNQQGSTEQTGQTRAAQQQQSQGWSQCFLNLFQSTDARGPLTRRFNETLERENINLKSKEPAKGPGAAAAAVPELNMNMLTGIFDSRKELDENIASQMQRYFNKSNEVNNKNIGGSQHVGGNGNGNIAGNVVVQSGDHNPGAEKFSVSSNVCSADERAFELIPVHNASLLVASKEHTTWQKKYDIYKVSLVCRWWWKREELMRLYPRYGHEKSKQDVNQQAMHEQEKGEGEEEEFDAKKFAAEMEKADANQLRDVFTAVSMAGVGFGARGPSPEEFREQMISWGVDMDLAEKKLKAAGYMKNEEDGDDAITPNEAPQSTVRIVRNNTTGGYDLTGILPTQEQPGQFHPPREPHPVPPPLPTHFRAVAPQFDSNLEAPFQGLGSRFNEDINNNSINHDDVKHDINHDINHDNTNMRLVRAVALGSPRPGDRPGTRIFSPDRPRIISPRPLPLVPFEKNFSNNNKSRSRAGSAGRINPGPNGWSPRPNKRRDTNDHNIDFSKKAFQQPPAQMQPQMTQMRKITPRGVPLRHSPRAGGFIPKNYIVPTRMEYPTSPRPNGALLVPPKGVLFPGTGTRGQQGTYPSPPREVTPTPPSRWRMSDNTNMNILTTLTTPLMLMPAGAPPPLPTVNMPKIQMIPVMSPVLRQQQGVNLNNVDGCVSGMSPVKLGIVPLSRVDLNMNFEQLQQQTRQREQSNQQQCSTNLQNQSQPQQEHQHQQASACHLPPDVVPSVPPLSLSKLTSKESKEHQSKGEHQTKEDQGKHVNGNDVDDDGYSLDDRRFFFGQVIIRKKTTWSRELCSDLWVEVKEKGVRGVIGSNWNVGRMEGFLRKSVGSRWGGVLIPFDSWCLWLDARIGSSEIKSKLATARVEKSIALTPRQHLLQQDQQNSEQIEEQSNELSNNTDNTKKNHGEKAEEVKEDINKDKQPSIVTPPSHTPTQTLTQTESLPQRDTIQAAQSSMTLFDVNSPLKITMTPKSLLRMPRFTGVKTALFGTGTSIETKNETKNNHQQEQHQPPSKQNFPAKQNILHSLKITAKSFLSKPQSQSGGNVTTPNTLNALNRSVPNIPVSPMMMTSSMAMTSPMIMKSRMAMTSPMAINTRLKRPKAQGLAKKSADTEGPEVFGGNFLGEYRGPRGFLGEFS